MTNYLQWSNVLLNFKKIIQTRRKKLAVRDRRSLQLINTMWLALSTTLRAQWLQIHVRWWSSESVKVSNSLKEGFFGAEYTQNIQKNFYTVSTVMVKFQNRDPVRNPGLYHFLWRSLWRFAHERYGPCSRSVQNSMKSKFSKLFKNFERSQVW